MSFNRNYIVSYLYITMARQKAGRRKKDKVGKEQYEVEVVYKRYNAPAYQELLARAKTVR